ncbi:MAG: biotin/lipoyl-containing protein [Vulcanimicrobiaceae bacterium]
MVEVTMPKMGATMTEGTVAAWRVQPGQAVKVGDVLCEVETDKASIDVESEHAGTIDALLVNEGDTVAIGIPIARLAT